MNENSVSDKRIRMKTILRIAVIVFVVVSLIMLTVSALGRPYDKAHTTYTNIVIEEGDSTSDIAQKLKDEGIIGNVSRFEFLSKILFYDGKYKAGTYFLSPSMDIRSICQTMENGITTRQGFEIPAGLTVEQTAEALAQAGFCDKEAFMTIASDTDFGIFDFIDNDISGPEKLEGYLMPGTYAMNSEASEAMLIITFLNEFEHNFTAEYKERASELGLSVRDVLTIASMIEKETKIDSERAMVSSVIHNKLNKGVEFDNGYPDGPLCSPGMASIKAALYPEESDYIYCAPSSKLNGTHIFTSDYDEYLELMEAYKAAKSEEGK